MASVRPAQTSLLRGIIALYQAFCVTLGCGGLLAGCAAPAPPPAKPASPPPAHLTVINLTDYEWHIAVARISGEAVSDFRLKAHASFTVDLPGGEFMIQQTAFSDAGVPPLTRTIPAKLEPGQTYRWRLVTLLSETNAGLDSR